MRGNSVDRRLHAIDLGPEARRTLTRSHGAMYHRKITLAGVIYQRKTTLGFAEACEYKLASTPDLRWGCLAFGAGAP